MLHVCRQCVIPKSKKDEDADREPQSEPQPSYIYDTQSPQKKKQGMKYQISAFCNTKDFVLGVHNITTSMSKKAR